MLNAQNLYIYRFIRCHNCVTWKKLIYWIIMLQSSLSHFQKFDNPWILWWLKLCSTRIYLYQTSKYPCQSCIFVLFFTPEETLIYMSFFNLCKSTRIYTTVNYHVHFKNMHVNLFFVLAQKTSVLKLVSDNGLESAPKLRVYSCMHWSLKGIFQNAYLGN